MDISEFVFATIDKNSNYWNEVISLAIECDQEFYPPLSERMPIIEYFEKFNKENGFVTIVTQDEKLIGSSCGYLFHSDFKVAYSQFTLIDKNYRNKILARELINFVFKVCKHHGAYFIQARTWSTNFASRKLIKDTGFYQTSVIPNDRPNNVHTYEFEKCLFENNLFKNIKRLGILGGMGSSASAKFLSEICMLSNQTEKEQDQLPIILHSETVTADRTELILSDKKDVLAKTLETQINNLAKQGVTDIVICCFTYHAVLNLISPKLKKMVISLIDFTNKMLENKRGKYLVLSTNGSYKIKLLQLNENIIYPQKEDQLQIHECIYKIKKGEPKEIIFDNLTIIIDKYDVEGIILACTDLYLMSELFDRKINKKEIINPLKTIAYNICDDWKQNLNIE